MKYILLVIQLIFLCDQLIIAQQKINKEIFENLVDYANCRYVQSFIEKYDLDKDYFKDYYLKKVKPELDKVNLNDYVTIISYENLKRFLSNNAPALQLAKRINDRKFKYDEFNDNQSLINSLLTTGWNNVDLSNTAADIQNKIRTILNLNNDKNRLGISENEVIKTQTIQTSTQVEELLSIINQLEQQYENLNRDTQIIAYHESFEEFKMTAYIIFGIFFVVIIGVYVIIKIKFKKNVIKQVLESKEIEAVFCSKKETINIQFSPEDFNKIFELIRTGRLINYTMTNQAKQEEHYKQIQEAGFAIAKKKRYLRVNLVEQVEGSIPIENEPKLPKFNTEKTTKGLESSSEFESNAKYLKGKSGKIFSRLDDSPENSFFKLIDEKDGNAQFVFYGNETEAIAKRVFSEDICNIVSGSYQNANSVKTVTPGRIKQVGDNWEVTEPVKIKLF